MLRAAIVGCGTVGRGHAEAYRLTRHVELAAVVDAAHQCAIDLGKAARVPCFTDLSEVLRRDDVDLIDVCLPSGLHGDAAIAAARSGKHCICEKPLDVTPQRCDEMIRAHDEAGTVLAGVFQHRFADDARRVRAALDEGRFGQVALVTCSTPWWRSQAYYDSGSWRGTWRLDGGGALMNQSIHAIDLALWFGGPVRRVRGTARLIAHERIEVEDTAVGVLEFESGALGVLQGTTAAYPGSATRHEIMGSDGTCYLVGDRIDLWKLRDEIVAAEEAGEASAAEVVDAAAAEEDVGGGGDPGALHIPLFARNLDDTALAIAEGRDPIVSGREARRAVEVICAIYESSRRGEPVDLPLERFEAGDV